MVRQYAKRIGTNREGLNPTEDRTKLYKKKCQLILLSSNSTTVELNAARSVVELVIKLTR